VTVINPDEHRLLIALTGLEHIFTPQPYWRIVDIEGCNKNLTCERHLSAIYQLDATPASHVVRECGFFGVPSYHRHKYWNN
jgi:hypothetical protein